MAGVQPVPANLGANVEDLDSFFGSAKPSAAPSYSGSYTASPANMASPAASLGIPDDRSDFDLFGNINTSSSQHAQHSQAAARPSASGAVDPFDLFDLFGEGSTVPASAATAATATSANPASTSADDSLFGDVGGYQGGARCIHATMHTCMPPRHVTGERSTWKGA